MDFSLSGVPDPKPFSPVLATSDGVKHLYGLDRIGVQQNGTWYTPLPDALGSVRQWAHATGAVVGTASYTPFGVPTQQQGLTPAPWGFSGEWHDAATGLQYLRARWYQPQTGRFTQVDPFPGLLSLPGTQHPYSYGLNDPTRYTDPSGESVIATILVSAAIAASVNVFFQVIEQQNAGLSFSQALGCINLPEVVGAAVGGAVMGLFMGFVAEPVLLLVMPRIALVAHSLAALVIELSINIGAGAISGAIGGQAGAVAKAVTYEIIQMKNGNPGNIKTFRQTLQDSGFLDLDTMALDGYTGGVSAGAGYVWNQVAISLQMADLPHWDMQLHPDRINYKMPFKPDWRKMVMTLIWSWFQSSMEEVTQTGAGDLVHCGTNRAIVLTNAREGVG